MIIRTIVGKRHIAGACLASLAGAFVLVAPAAAATHARPACAGHYVFGPIHLESIASEADGTALFLGEHGGQAIVYPYSASPGQEWSGYRDAACSLIIYNGNGNDVLTQSVGAHCFERYADCVTVEPYSKGNPYQEWTRDIYGSTWVIRPLSGMVDQGKAIDDPQGSDRPATPVVLTSRHDTRAAQQWQA